MTTPSLNDANFPRQHGSRGFEHGWDNPEVVAAITDRYNVPAGLSNGLEIDYTGSAKSLNVELERTPGAAAVSEGLGYGRGDEPRPQSFQQIPLRQTHLPSWDSSERCGTGAVLTHDVSETHWFGKKLVCGKEWCPDCGEPDSQSHLERIAALLPKAQRLSSMGYLVIEWPIRDRRDPKHIYSKAGLQKAMKLVKTVLAGKRQGRHGRVGGFFARGFGRWHYASDYAGIIKGQSFAMAEVPHGAEWHDAFGELVTKIQNLGAQEMAVTLSRTIHKMYWSEGTLLPVDSTCESMAEAFGVLSWPVVIDYMVLMTLCADELVKSFADAFDFAIWPHENLAADAFNPHLNVLVDGGFLNAATLDEIKGHLRDALNCPDLIVNYSVATTPAKMYHAVRYVARATFRDVRWDSPFAMQLGKLPKHSDTEIDGIARDDYGDTIFDAPFRNGMWWGQWNDAPVWDVTPDVAQNEREAGAMAVVMSMNDKNDDHPYGVCPICNEPLVKWSKPFSASRLKAWGAVEYFNSGYFVIPTHDHSETIKFSEQMDINNRRFEERIEATIEMATARAHKRESSNDDWWNAYLGSDRLN